MKLVVRNHNPRRWIVASLLGTLFVVGSGWGLFEYGRARSGLDFSSLGEENRRLSEENAKLKGALTESTERQAVLERTQQIEREAYKQLESDVSGLQAQVSSLTEELGFYKSLVAPAGAAGGLHVQSLDIEKNGLERGYRYKLVLTQVRKNDTVARGRAEVVIEGSRQGRMMGLKLAELDPQSGNLDFSFKYFQNFEGNFQVPVGFSPVRITVKITPRDERYKPFDKVFNWPA